MGLLDSVFGGILGAVQMHKADQINPVYSPYTTSQYAKDNLSTAQNAYNGRMAGATTLEQNILGNQSNQNANVDRNATDGAQALAVKAAGQGQTNQAFSNLQTQEAQNKYQMLNNLNLANNGMTQEGDKVYQSQLQKYQMDVSQQSALRSAGINNLFGAVSGLGGSAMMMNMMNGSSGGSSGGSKGGGSDLTSMLPFLL